ncbi:MAG TPA: ABC transporter permease [Gaiellaceae bacterium]|jgi:peptide/nickel transport system permease protein|nr:ABC transporter permease [Gaiellaceae bacterium]
MVDVSVPVRPRVPEGLVATAARRLFRNPVTLAGLVIALAVALLGLLAPLIAPYGATEGNPDATLQPPSWDHPFGTDPIGFDILSRVLHGARLDLGIALGAVAIALLAGCLLGAVAGFFGRFTDEVVMRGCDMLSAFPSFILALGVVAALGASVPNLIFAIALVNVSVYARLLRARVLTVREAQYVRAATAIGCSRTRLMFAHVLPNSMAPIFVQSTLQAGYAILEAAGLSFIGLGVRVPTAEWGVMVNMGLQYVVSGEWWISFFPGMAIAVTVMGFNLIGDGLQDLLDPKRR